MSSVYSRTNYRHFALSDTSIAGSSYIATRMGKRCLDTIGPTDLLPQNRKDRNTDIFKSLHTSRKTGKTGTLISLRACTRTGYIYGVSVQNEAVALHSTGSLLNAD
ncbi:hypothetical protein QE152_g9267 [Popillia japonica]|uniref:Uncharacterized protein n=1 Tax=Popillia japonica TaxID=7064 RepID=A0AAW1M0B8_POPJA